MTDTPARSSGARSPSTPGGDEAATRRALDVALLTLAEQRRRPPCAEPGQPDPFAIDPDVRAAATEVCSWCPIATPCAAVGEHEGAGVWGGIDRTPKFGRRPRGQEGAA